MREWALAESKGRLMINSVSILQKFRKISKICLTKRGFWGDELVMKGKALKFNESWVLLNNLCSFV